MHAVVPGYVMEPEQVRLRAGFERCELTRDFGMILLDRLASVCAPIKPNSLLIGAMKVDGRPIRATLAHPRTRPVMMVPSHQVVQPERRHVIDASLSRLQHHCCHGT